MKPIKYVGRMVIMDHSIFYLFLNQNRPENGQFGGKSCNFGLKIEITCIYTGKHIKIWVISFQVTKMKPMKYGGHVVIMDHSIVFFNQNRPENGQFGAKSCNFGQRIEITRYYTGENNKT